MGSRRSGSSSRRDVEEEWGEQETEKTTVSRQRIYVFALIAMALMWGALVYLRGLSQGDPEPESASVAEEEVEIELDPNFEAASRKAENVFQLFLKGSDDDRTGLLRDPGDADTMKVFFENLREESGGLNIKRSFFLFARDRFEPPHFLYGVWFAGDQPRLLAVFWDDSGEQWYEGEPKVDWDCVIARNEGWEEFTNGEIENATARLIVRPSQNYEDQFKDSSEWQSYTVWRAGLLKPLNGYVRRGSRADRVLSEQFESDSGTKPMILKLSKTGSVISNRQVVIEDVVAKSWILE